MQISYRNSFLDILTFQVAHQFFSVAYQTIFALVCVFIFAVEHENRSLELSFFIALGWYIVGWLAQILFTALILGLKRGSTISVEHMLEVRDDALLEETEFMRALYYWSGPMKIVHRAGLIGVYVSPDMAHIIPRHAFKSKVHKAEFFEKIRANIRPAK